MESVLRMATAPLELDGLLAELLDAIRDLMEVDTAAVLLLDRSAQHLVAAAAKGLEEEVRQGVRIPLGKGFAGRVAADGKPVVYDRVDHTNVVNPILREKGIRALLGVPLWAGDGVVGVLHVGMLTDRRFNENDVELLQLIGDRVGLAASARITEIERVAAAALQRDAIPAVLPLLPDLELAARFVPNEGGAVGGDWYDVFTPPSGGLYVIMGDVVGRGFQAAVVMGRLRSALRSYALDGADPAEVLGRVDRKVLHFEQGMVAAALCAKFDPSFEHLELSCAGHPVPVLARPDRPTTVVDVPPDPPLGVRFGVRRTTSAVEMSPGSLMCFYSDGLVERRGRTFDEGLRQLCESLVAGPAESICATVMAKLVGSDPPEDDVALLAVRRRTHADINALDLTLPALPDSLRDIRRAVGRWLAMAGATPEDTTDLLLVVGEACSNVVEHAYGPGGGTISVRMELRSPDVLVTVCDTGTWRPTRGRNRGRGLTLIETCSDELHIDRGPAGTELHVRRRLGRGGAASGQEVP